MGDEAWERAVEAALQAGGNGSSSPARSLTLDGTVKCTHGRLPSAAVLERHQSLEHLSIAGVGVSSLEGFPRLPNLARLTLSDNRIASGLHHLVAAGLSSLRDLDLSNNRIQDVVDLAPLAELRIVSLDLYQCPVTRVEDYKSRVFGMIPTLKYLDKMDVDGNERTDESDDDDDDDDGDDGGDGEEDDDEDEDEEEEEEDPASGDQVANGGVPILSGSVPWNPVKVMDDDEEDYSDADEILPNGGVEQHQGVDGAFYIVAAVGGAPDQEDEDLYEDDGDYQLGNDHLVEEIDEDSSDEEDDVVEVYDVLSSDEEVDGVEENLDDEVDGEEVEDDEESTGMVALMTGEVGDEEIDGQDYGEEDDEDENGEIGEEDHEGLEDDRVYEEDQDADAAADEVEDAKYLIQPIARPPAAMAIGSDEPQDMTIRRDIDAVDSVDVDEDKDEVDDDNKGPTYEPSSSQGGKRKRDDDPSDSGDDDEDDGVENLRPSKRH